MSMLVGLPNYNAPFTVASVSHRSFALKSGQISILSYVEVRKLGTFSFSKYANAQAFLSEDFEFFILACIARHTSAL